MLDRRHGEWVSWRERWPLALLPVSTGAAVLVAIVFSTTSLVWPTLLLVAGSAATAVAFARRLPGAVRSVLAARVRAGALVGLAATAVYDLVRYAVVALAGWSFRPFAVFARFGAMLVGADASPVARYAAGTAFHLLNGLGFAIAYAVVVRRPGVPSAVAWALVLEALTVVFYPSWLGLGALGEFASTSLLGHVGYGVALGLGTRRAAFARRPAAGTAPTRRRGQGR